MTYIEAFNQYSSETESISNQIEDAIATALKSHGLEPTDNFTYQSFLENVKLKVYKTDLSSKEVNAILSKAVVPFKINNAMESYVLKTENRGNVEYLLNVQLLD